MAQPAKIVWRKDTGGRYLKKNLVESWKHQLAHGWPTSYISLLQSSTIVRIIKQYSIRISFFHIFCWLPCYNCQPLTSIFQQQINQLPLETSSAQYLMAWWTNRSPDKKEKTTVKEAQLIWNISLKLIWNPFRTWAELDIGQRSTHPDLPYVGSVVKSHGPRTSAPGPLAFQTLMPVIANMWKKEKHRKVVWILSNMPETSHAFMLSTCEIETIQKEAFLYAASHLTLKLLDSPVKFASANRVLTAAGHGRSTNRCLHDALPLTAARHVEVYLVNTSICP